MKRILKWLGPALASLLVAVAPSIADPSSESATEHCVGKVRLRGTIFDLQAAELEPGLGAILDGVAKRFLEACPEKLLIIEVHASELPTPELNQRLSELRALGLRYELAKRGIPESQLLPAGLGSSKPMDGSDDLEAMKLNRRVTFRVAD